MPLTATHISIGKGRWFFTWDDIGVHLGWVWRGKAREAARMSSVASPNCVVYVHTGKR
jgi:hypothetical protein